MAASRRSPAQEPLASAATTDRRPTHSSSAPSGLSLATDGTLYIADTTNLRIRAQTETVPTIIGAPADTVGTTTATLGASVTSDDADATYHFEWGPTTTYGNTAGAGDETAGTGQQSVTADLTGLAPNTTYHFRLVATNANGTTLGDDIAFTTSAIPATIAPPAQPAPQPPAAQPPPPQSAGRATAGATVADPAGQEAGQEADHQDHGPHDGPLQLRPLDADPSRTCPACAACEPERRTARTSRSLGSPATRRRSAGSCPTAATSPSAKRSSTAYTTHRTSRLWPTGPADNPRQRETGPKTRAMNRKVIVTITYKALR